VVFGFETASTSIVLGAVQEAAEEDDEQRGEIECDENVHHKFTSNAPAKRMRYKI